MRPVPGGPPEVDADSGSATTFGSDPEAFAALSGPTVGALVAAASDVAVILDHAGVVTDVAVSDQDLPPSLFQEWLGRPFVETVTVESRPKLKRLFEPSGSAIISAPTQINHVRDGAEDLPVRYRAAALGDTRVIAMGRDLTPLANAQRRLLTAQRNADREYTRLRASEMRFRQYFHQSDEPVFFVDVQDRITEVNEAASAMWPRQSRFAGRKVSDLLPAGDRAALVQAMTEAREKGRSVVRRLSVGHLILAPLRQEPGALLMRLVDRAKNATSVRDRLSRIVEEMPDGFVVTDGTFNVLTANAAFIAMTATLSAEHISGRSLEEWLGRPGVDVSIIRNALMSEGSLRAFSTVLNGDLGQVTEVEVSAAKVTDADGEYVGLSIRPAGVPDAVLPPRSAQHLADLVGRVPLKEIVRETTDTIERLCIEGALELSNDNRASAAELLGLSRQSLYVKMRRYGIDDDGSEAPAV